MRNAEQIYHAIYVQIQKRKKMTNYNKEYAGSIQDMFASIAKEYDKTNAILSFNLHRFWNKKLVKLTAQVAGNNPVLLDLCAGTGEITQTWLKQFNSPQTAYLLDFCPEMLNLAKKKLNNLPHHLDFIHGNAEQISLSDESVNAITIAYGIRNVHGIENCFREAKRVLKPGGTLGILELTAPSIAVLKPLHKFYLKHVLPILGGLVTKNEEAYRYLCQSIQSFIKPEEIKTHLMSLGYQQVNIHSLSCGIATVIIAKK